MLKKTEIPNLYINASSTFETEEDFVDYIKYANALLVAQGKKEYFDLSDDAKTKKVERRYIENSTKWREEHIMPYVEALGNCQYVGEEGKIVLERIIGGENPIHMYKFIDADILILLGNVGCPACAGNLDLFNAMGINKVMFCGGGGVLDKNIEVGQILVVDGAIRDEGFSYHYIEPSRYIYTDKKVTDKIVKYLDEKDISYLRGITWTTDALFRKTEDRIELRKKEGAKIVEMEQSGCIAVAQYST